MITIKNKSKGELISKFIGEFKDVVEEFAKKVNED